MFHASFGLSAVVVAQIWTYYLSESVSFSPKHLLWALYFLKVYSTMDTMYSRFCGSRDNFAHKIWLVIAALVELLPDVGYFPMIENTKFYRFVGLISLLK